MSNGDLINRKHCKEFAIRIRQDFRIGWDADRVSKEFLDDIDATIRSKIIGAIKRHPTVGKTIKYLF